MFQTLIRHISIVTPCNALWITLLNNTIQTNKQQQATHIISTNDKQAQTNRKQVYAYKTIKQPLPLPSPPSSLSLPPPLPLPLCGSLPQYVILLAALTGFV